MAGHNNIEEIGIEWRMNNLERVYMYLPKKWQIISLKHLRKLSTTCKIVNCGGQVKFEDEWGSLLATFQEKM